MSMPDSMKLPGGSLREQIAAALLYEDQKVEWSEAIEVGVDHEWLKAADAVLEVLERNKQSNGRARQITEHQALALIKAYNGGLAVVDAMIKAGLNWPPVCDALQHARWCSDERPCAYNAPPTKQASDRKLGDEIVEIDRDMVERASFAICKSIQEAGGDANDANTLILARRALEAAFHR